jgi:chemotaxis-related protein WspB
MLILVFRVSDNLYAIDTSRIVEVIPRVLYREAHHVPDYVAGIFNYRGSIVPVIDLCLLTRGTPSKNHLSTRVMMVSYPQADHTVRYVGLMAERVIETLNKAAESFKDAGIAADEAPYLTGVITHEKGIIQRICPDQLFEYAAPLVEHRSISPL